LEGRCDALLHGQNLPQTAPAALDAVFLQLPSNVSERRTKLGNCCPKFTDLIK